MRVINITAFTDNNTQVNAIKSVMKALKIKFEVTKQEDTTVIISELQNSLSQVQQIKTGKLPKQTVKEFLNEL
jgi:hypothetical protein